MVDVPVTFRGVGFGRVPPVLQFSHPGISARIAPGSNSPTQFTAYLTASDAGSYEVTVTSGGYSGFFFQGAGSSPQNSTGKAISVTPTPGPEVLEVKVNGTAISSGARVVLPAASISLGVSATLSGEGVTGNVAFRLSASYKDPKQTKPECPPPFRMDVASGTVAVGSVWTADLTVGGNVVLEWSLNGGPTRRSFSFLVVGENPDRQTLLQELGDSPWYLKQLIGVESSNPPLTPYHNFYPESFPDAARRGLPVWGTPCGYGVMQVDPPPNLQSIFSWRENIRQGKEVKLAEKITVADDWWVEQRRQWATYNQNSGANIPMRPNQSEGACVFSEAPVEPQHHFKDALAIKAYNGAKAHYIAWSGTDSTPGTWVIHNTSPVTINGKLVLINQVERVCNFVVP